MPVPIPSFVRRAIGNIIDPEDISRVMDYVDLLASAFNDIGGEVTGLVTDALANDETVQGAVSDAITGQDIPGQVETAVDAEIEGRNILEGAGRYLPALILSPDGSANQSGSVSPSTIGSPTTAAGAYGTAWVYTATGQRKEITNSGYLAAIEGTLIIRARFTVALTTNGEYQQVSNGTTDGLRWVIRRTRGTSVAGNVTYFTFQAAASGVLGSVNVGADIVPDDTDVTLAVTWKGGTMRVFVDGVFGGASTFTPPDNGAGTLHTAANGGVYPYQTETHLYYTEALPDAEVLRVSQLAAAHTIATYWTDGDLPLTATEVDIAPELAGYASRVRLRAIGGMPMVIGGSATGAATVDGIELQTIEDTILVEDEAGPALPYPARTLSVVGDLHVGYTGRAEQEDRLDAIFSDLATLKSLHIHRLYAGDQVDSPGAGAVGTTPGVNDTAFLARATALDPDRDTWDAAIGNHDQGARQADNWAAVYGYADQNWTRDLGFCRIVSVGADNTTDYPSQHQTLSSTTMDWLDATLGESGAPTIILSHGPLAYTSNTMAPGGAFAGGITTANQAMRSAPEAGLYALLEAHPQVIAWMCGHTHGRYEAVGAVTRQWVGNRHIASINAGAINWTDTSVSSAEDPVRSLFVAVLDDRLEVYIRNHDDQAWEALRGELPYVLPRTTVRAAVNPTAFVVPLADDTLMLTQSGPVATTLIGAPSLVDDGDGEHALELDVGTKALTINPSGLLLAAQGSLIVRCTFGAHAGSSQMAVNQAASDGLNRIFLQRAQLDSVLAATMGGTDGGGSPYSWGSLPRTITDDEIVTLGLDWADGEGVTRINGEIVGRGGYDGLAATGTLMSFGRSSSMTGILGLLYGAAGFTRPLTSQEHMRFVEASTDDWSLRTWR